MGLRGWPVITWEVDAHPANVRTNARAQQYRLQRLANFTVTILLDEAKLTRQASTDCALNAQHSRNAVLQNSLLKRLSLDYKCFDHGMKKHRCTGIAARHIAMFDPTQPADNTSSRSRTTSSKPITTWSAFRRSPGSAPCRSHASVIDASPEIRIPLAPDVALCVRRFQVAGNSTIPRTATVEYMSPTTNAQA